MKKNSPAAARVPKAHGVMAASAVVAALTFPVLAMAQNVAAAVAEMAVPVSDAAAAVPAADNGADPATVAAAADGPITTVEVASHKTRSSVAINKSDMQKILPGINPLKALETLPGVSFQTADPWGNNEQNLSLFVHGFSGQQLGYTMDGVPLGDQQYGNYNGLSPQRAVISENVSSVILSSGAGDLATASTSNLGGAIETFSSDPSAKHNIAVQQPSAATTPRALSCASTPATTAAAAPTSRPCIRKRAPGTSTRARAATSSTPNTSTIATPAS